MAKNTGRGTRAAADPVVRERGARMRDGYPDDPLPPVDGRIFRSDVSTRRWIAAGVLLVLFLYGLVTYVSWLIVSAT